MTKHQRTGLYISILSVIGLVSLVLLFYFNFPESNTDDSNFGLEGIGMYEEEDDLLEVVAPMSCTYRGKLKLDADTQSSLKKYQKILQ